MTAFTLVQEHPQGHGPTSAQVLYGQPSETLAGGIHKYPPGRLVVHLVRQFGRARVFVFRTLGSSFADESATLVPGVRPAVRLLLVAYTGRRIYRVRQMLRCAQRSGKSPDSLSDGFFLRAAATLSRRESVENIVAALLQHEPPDRNAAIVHP